MDDVTNASALRSSVGHRPVFARRPSDLIVKDAYIAIGWLLCGSVVHLKIEAFNAAGSIKMKTARFMIEQLEQTGKVRSRSHLIESSSGNLGVALAMLAAERDYRFTCVTDKNTSQQSVKLMRAFGAEVIILDQRDDNGGYLGSRIAYIKSRLAADPELLWLNQYANLANPTAHEYCTGPEILADFPRPDFLFIGAGTTGTLNGVARVIRARSPRTRIIAVDSCGSVTFGTPPSRRYIPGIGTSRRPEIATEEAMDDLELVGEADTIIMCRRLAARGLLIGGSTGTVLAAVAAWRRRIPENSCVVAISPDLGDRYLDSIYDDAWVESHFAGLLTRRRDEALATAAWGQAYDE